MKQTTMLSILFLFLFAPSTFASTCSEYIADFHDTKMEGKLQPEYAQEITELARSEACPELYLTLLKNQFSGIERGVFKGLGDIKTKYSKKSLINVWEKECLEYGSNYTIDNEHICPIIAVSLYKNGNQKYLERVLEIARTQKTGIRVNIASALGQLDTDESRDILYMFLQEDKKGVTRCFAAKSLLNLGETRVLEIMMNQLDTPMETPCHKDILLEHGKLKERNYGEAICKPAHSNNP